MVEFGPEAVKDGGKSPEKLVSSVLSIWEMQGASGVSARSLAAMAELPVSSIYYHFGDLERLSETAQGEAQAAAQLWCDEQLKAIRGIAEGVAALGPLLAALVDDWCETRRTLAFAWRECQLMALRDAKHLAASGRWAALWRRFWEEVCARLGIADMGLATAWTFEGLAAIHMLRWRRPVDRAALDEMSHGWANWLQGHLSAPAAWFDMARGAAVPPVPSVDGDPALDQIAVAAAAVIERGGVAALTHRAVATEAGLTLGVVSYKYRTSADLLQAAFEVIYRRIVPQTPGDPATVAISGREEAFVRLDVGFPARQNLLGAEELTVAAARDPAFAAFSVQLRYLRGRSSGRFLQALLGPDRPIAPIDAAIFSAYSAGRSRAYALGGHAPLPGAAQTDLSPLLARLDRR